MLKRNPDAQIFCDGPDQAPTGVCAHCGGVTPSTAEYCGFDCRLKASEAVSAKRIADLEAKVEELLTKEQMREGAERAVEEAAWAAQERAIAYARAEMDVYTQMQREREQQLMRLGPRGLHDPLWDVRRESYSDIICNCIPSRASLLTGRNRATLSSAEPTARSRQSYDNREWAAWALGLMVVVTGVGSIVGLS